MLKDPIAQQAKNGHGSTKALAEISEVNEQLNPNEPMNKLKDVITKKASESTFVQKLLGRQPERVQLEGFQKYLNNVGKMHGLENSGLDKYDRMKLDVLKAQTKDTRQVAGGVGAYIGFLGGAAYIGHRQNKKKEAEEKRRNDILERAIARRSKKASTLKDAITKEAKTAEDYIKEIGVRHPDEFKKVQHFNKQNEIFNQHNKNTSKTKYLGLGALTGAAALGIPASIMSWPQGILIGAAGGAMVGSALRNRRVNKLYNEDPDKIKEDNAIAELDTSIDRKLGKGASVLKDAITKEAGLGNLVGNYAKTQLKNPVAAATGVGIGAMTGNVVDAAASTVVPMYGEVKSAIGTMKDALKPSIPTTAMKPL